MHLEQLYNSFFINTGTFVLLMIFILAGLLVKHRSVGKSPVLTRLVCLVTCFFGMVLLYYYESFMGKYTGQFERSVISRIADFSLYVMSWYFWISFLLMNLYKAGYVREKTDKQINILLIASLVIFTLSCILFIDDSYYVKNHIARIVLIAVESISYIIWSGLNVCYTLESMKAGLQRSTKLFIITCSPLLLLFGIYDEIVTIRLMTGNMSYRIESFYYEPAYLAMTLIVVSTLVYIFKHDFSPLYFRENTICEISDTEVLKRLGTECGLSKREAEVADLIFRGDSYEDIAEKLFISKLTVKKHVHNLYEKLNVSKRMELINLVRYEKERLYNK